MTADDMIVHCSFIHVSLSTWIIHVGISICRKWPPSLFGSVRDKNKYLLNWQCWPFQYPSCASIFTCKVSAPCLPIGWDFTIPLIEAISSSIKIVMDIILHWRSKSGIIFMLGLLLFVICMGHHKAKSLAFCTCFCDLLLLEEKFYIFHTHLYFNSIQFNFNLFKPIIRWHSN